LAANYWREILAAYYPDSWQRFVTIFEQRVTALPSKAVTSATKHQDDGSFGYALWLIIGGEKAKLDETAKQLGISLSTLCGFLHKKKRISQQVLAHKKWHMVFMTYYPEGWKQYMPLFEERAAKLPKKEKVGYTKQL